MYFAALRYLELPKITIHIETTYLFDAGVVRLVDLHGCIDHSYSMYINIAAVCLICISVG